MKKLNEEWQCSWCLKTYSFNQWNKLKSVEVCDMPEYGVTKVCECGKRFGVDKWNITQKISLGWFSANIIISTVHLELNHFGFYYETMVFVDNKWYAFDKLQCFYQVRHKTQEEAERNHKILVERLNHKKYKIQDGILMINDSK